MTVGEDYTVASPLVVPLELCGNTTRVQIPTISDYELLERSTEYFTVQVSEFDGGLETITTSITVFIVEPTGGEYTLRAVCMLCVCQLYHTSACATHVLVERVCLINDLLLGE